MYDYPDHHRFTGKELSFNDNKPIFITSKDYVKLKKLRNKNIWIIIIRFILMINSSQN